MNYENDMNPEVREKMKKNLVYVGIFSIVMLFAGLTSGYYVSMGKSFWLKYPMPSGFYLSTLFIALSSLSFWWAIQGAKKESKGNSKALWLLLCFSEQLSFTINSKVTGN